MPCTTLLVGKKASYNGATIIARNDDSPSGHFHVKKLVVVEPSKNAKPYVSKIAHLTIELPKEALRYTEMPNVDPSEGVWAAAGVNEDNVAMSATETITSNPRVLGADPYVEYQPAKGGRKAVPGGIGEEDLVAIVLPYIHTAREGVLRLGELLEKYGTYEPNGIAFSDENEIWWLETIGGHHYVARRVEDDEYVNMPNQFGLDHFDLADAFGPKKKNLCSKDLREFISHNSLSLDMGVGFSPRLAFGSHNDSDHVYNTPRAWFMVRYFNPHTYVYEGDKADFTPESDGIPWSLRPERKITMEEAKYILSSHFQGTPYDPYGVASPKRGIYRSIGVNRTSFLACIEIRPNLPKETKTVEWICYGSNAFNAMVPFYPLGKTVPSYLGKTTLKVSTESFYWASRLIGALADAHFSANAMPIERYQGAMMNHSRELLAKYDALSLQKASLPLLDEANEAFAKMAQEETDKALSNVLFASSNLMRNGYSRSDN